jgi:hypothetical protein
MRKVIDEVIAVVSAAEEHGGFEAHHRDELAVSLERLAERFDCHAAYEETEIFEEMAPMLEEDRREAIEQAIQQHRRFMNRLGEARELLGEVEPGAGADDETVSELREWVFELEEIWDRHDETERAIFGP